MVAKRKEQRQRFEIYDDPGVRVWDAKPGNSVIEDLRSHMRSDGRPDMWRWHLNTKPPPGSPSPVLVAINIDVPERLRPSVGLAPCPLCSVAAPRFFQGVLTWWPAEKALRVIGHDCADKHFKGFAAERKRFHRDKQADADFDYLVERLPHVPAVMSLLASMADTAVALDKLRHRARLGLSSRVARDLHRHVEQHRFLALEESREVDQHGTPRRMAVVVKSLPIAGWRMLLPPPSTASAMLDTAGRSLAGLSFTSEDEIIAAIGRWQAEGMREACIALVTAARNIKQAHALCSDTQAFLAPSNLEQLLNWSFDHRASVRIDIKRDQFGSYVLSHKPHRVTIPAQAPELFVALPDITVVDLLDPRDEQMPVQAREL